jgi:hypothetical protein
MTNQTNYVGTWVMRDSLRTLAARDILIAGDEISITKHQRAIPPLECYTIERVRKGDSGLNTLTLIPRGQEPVRWGNEQRLPRGGSPHNRHLKDLQVALKWGARRLEGDLRKDNATFAVMAWIVEDAVQEGDSPPQPLLVIDIRSTENPLWSENESGTGTGDPKKP